MAQWEPKMTTVDQAQSKLCLFFWRRPQHQQPGSWHTVVHHPRRSVMSLRGLLWRERALPCIAERAVARARNLVAHPTVTRWAAKCHPGKPPAESVQWDKTVSSQEPVQRVQDDSCPKNYQYARILHDSAPKMTEFYIIIAREKYFPIFFWGGERPLPCPRLLRLWNCLNDNQRDRSSTVQRHTDYLLRSCNGLNFLKCPKVAVRTDWLQLLLIFLTLMFHKVV